MLHLTRRDVPPLDIPITFTPPAGTDLPGSIYGRQNIAPKYCNEFAAGLVLLPSAGPAFWIIPQHDLDGFWQTDLPTAGGRTPELGKTLLR
jgi:hypothetical protein